MVPPWPLACAKLMIGNWCIGKEKEGAGLGSCHSWEKAQTVRRVTAIPGTRSPGRGSLREWTYVGVNLLNWLHARNPGVTPLPCTVLFLRKEIFTDVGDVVLPDRAPIKHHRQLVLVVLVLGVREPRTRPRRKTKRTWMAEKRGAWALAKVSEWTDTGLPISHQLA